jgi:hypothetical protein
VSDGPVASLRVQAEVSRARDRQASAIQLEVRRTMEIPSGYDGWHRGTANLGAGAPAV